jgi:putative transposase
MLFVEDINFVSWSKGLFCKQSLDIGLGQFFNILQHICLKTDTYFSKVDKNYTSQICPNCGTHTGKKELDVKIHSCFECGYEQDRDVAAAEVIRNRGLENIAVGTTVINRTGAVLERHVLGGKLPTQKLPRVSTQLSGASPMSDIRRCIL